ncbi:MAG TPA: thymidine phosphorylase [candidate division Zixibacteria bacterium]|nr:thymidine phosphorylase [candidate division Zixibacteria bacterium]
MTEMNPSEFIRAKRDGKRLDLNEIGAFISSYLSGDVADYQVTALLMAIYLNGMSDDEASALTRAYIDSGEVIEWSELGGIPVDKHSTGGVGDKVSLALAPLVAACGGFVPMLSGRGLGHTGGTLDKLESIPGFNTELSIEKLKKQVREVGCAMARQSGELAPADGRIYALRDVTATVESIPLISASIMSKKIAEGAKGLVIDLKSGSGAFMDTIDRARELANMLIAIGTAHGQKVVALVTDMSQPLGCAVGNALEAEEAILLLRGEKKFPRLEALTVRLAGEMLLLAGVVDTVEGGETLARKRLHDGTALEKFAKMVEAQSGDPRVADDLSLLPKAKLVRPIVIDSVGYIAKMDTRRIGMAAVNLGAGRLRAEDEIDQSAGFKFFAEIGDSVDVGDVIGEVHAKDEQSAETAVAEVLHSITLAETALDRPSLIIEKIT